MVQNEVTAIEENLKPESEKRLYNVNKRIIRKRPSTRKGQRRNTLFTNLSSKIYYTIAVMVNSLNNRNAEKKQKAENFVPEKNVRDSLAKATMTLKTANAQLAAMIGQMEVLICCHAIKTIKWRNYLLLQQCIHKKIDCSLLLERNDADTNKINKKEEEEKKHSAKPSTRFGEQAVNSKNDERDGDIPSYLVNDQEYLDNDIFNEI